VINPRAGGAPEAIAIPIHSGSATRNTTIDAMKSWKNFSPIPAFQLVIEARVFIAISKPPDRYYSFVVIFLCRSSPGSRRVTELGASLRATDVPEEQSR
jgi:hypothetical protein